jgi:5'-nucleotidase
MLASALLALLALANSLELGSASPTSTRRASTPILVGNDDGWAEANIRALYQTLKQAGFNPVISAPTENQSGTGSSTATPTPLTSPGQFNTIPVGAPAEGHNTTDSTCQSYFRNK